MGARVVDADRRVQHQIDAAGYGKIAFARAQAHACLVDGDERGRAGGVDRQARPLEPEYVREPVRGHTQGVTGTQVTVDALRLAREPVHVVTGADADKHASL